MHRIWNRLPLVAAVCLLCVGDNGALGQNRTDPYMPRGTGPSAGQPGGTYTPAQGQGGTARVPSRTDPRYNQGTPPGGTRGNPADGRGVYVPAPGRVAPTRMPQAPRAPFQLTPKEEQYLDKILNYWEYKSGQIKTFECQFTSWEYDPTQVRDPNIAYTINKGEIRYSTPDKGKYRVTEVRPVELPRRSPDGRIPPGARPTYNIAPHAHKPHWVTDGNSTFVFDEYEKKLKVEELPDHLKGKGISESPLPFVFGAKADKMKSRYWIRPIKPPPGSKGEYWLEAYPKRQQDAANYKRVEIILDEKDFLPKALQMYTTDRGARSVYQFSNRQVNASSVLSDLTGWMRRHFSNPATPPGWKRVEIKQNTPPPGMARPRRAAPGMSGRPGYPAGASHGGTQTKRF